MSRLSKVHVFSILSTPLYSSSPSKRAQGPWDRRRGADEQRGEKQAKRREGTCRRMGTKSVLGG